MLVMKDFYALSETSPSQPLSFVELGKMYSSKQQFFPVYARYRGALIGFKEVSQPCLQADVKADGPLSLRRRRESSLGMQQILRATCGSRGRSRRGSHSIILDHSVTAKVAILSLEEQLAQPLAHLSACLKDLETILSMCDEPPERQALQDAVRVLDQVRYTYSIVILSY